MKGWKGLSYLKYQEDRLKQFLNKNTGMKVLTQVDFKIITPAGDEDDDDVERQVVKFRSRRFKVLNTGDISDTLIKMADGDISDTLIKMADDIHTQIDKSFLSSSNIAIDEIDKLTIHYDKYNPTSG